MPELYLTPSSKSNLTQFMLTLLITVYLIGRTFNRRCGITAMVSHMHPFFPGNLCLLYPQKAIRAVEYIFIQY